MYKGILYFGYQKMTDTWLPYGTGTPFNITSKGLYHNKYRRILGIAILLLCFTLSSCLGVFYIDLGNHYAWLEDRTIVKIKGETENSAFDRLFSTTTHNTYWTETWANYLSKRHFGTAWIGGSGYPVKNISTFYLIRIRATQKQYPIMANSHGFI